MPLTFCQACERHYVLGSPAPGSDRCPGCGRPLQILAADEAAAAMEAARSHPTVPDSLVETEHPVAEYRCPKHPHEALPGSQVCPVCVTARLNHARRARRDAKSLSAAARSIRNQSAEVR